MSHLRFSTQINAGADELYRWHTRPAAFRRLIPPWTTVEVLSHEGVRDGSRATFRIHVGPTSFRWAALNEEVVEGRQFRDVQVRGPFGRWTHVHRFIDEGETSRLEDEIDYRMPIWALGNLLVGKAVGRRIRRWFAYRHQTTKNDLELHRRYSAYGRLRVGITGTDGLVGAHLSNFLEAGGHSVIRIVRTPPENPETEAYWNPREDAIDLEKLENLDAIIHLAGESVLSPRWSEQKKMEILTSRVRGTAFLAKAIGRLKRPPGAFISASAIGFYGNRDDELLDEDSPPGDDGFLSALCQEWELAASQAVMADSRVVLMRIGIVLSPAGGILKSLMIPFQMGLGGRYGGPRQYLSWVDLDDVLGAFYHVLTHRTVQGVVNVTSPMPVTMTEFAQTLGRVLSRPVYLNMPPWLIRMLLGEVADDAALMSVRVSPARLLEEEEYAFLYPTLEESLRHSLGRPAEPPEHRLVSRSGTTGNR